MKGITKMPARINHFRFADIPPKTENIEYVKNIQKEVI